MSTRPSGRLISTTSAHDPSPSAPISTSLKTQATYPPSVRERARKYPTAVAPPISRRSPAPAWRSASGWRRPIRATPPGSATCRSATTSSATCWGRRGRLDDALTAYRASLAIAERLAAADPSNAGWQRDLFVPYAKLGLTEENQQNFENAISYYHKARETIRQLTRLIPSNMQWQQDIVWIEERLTAVQKS